MSYRFGDPDPTGFRKWNSWLDRLTDFCADQGRKAWARNETLSNPFRVTHQGEYGRRIGNFIWNAVTAIPRFSLAVVRTAAAATAFGIGTVGLGLGAAAWEGVAKGGFKTVKGAGQILSGVFFEEWGKKWETILNGAANIGEGVLRVTGGVLSGAAIGGVAAYYGPPLLVGTILAGSAVGANYSLDQHDARKFKPGDPPPSKPSLWQNIKSVFIKENKQKAAVKQEATVSHAASHRVDVQQRTASAHTAGKTPAVAPVVPAPKAVERNPQKPETPVVKQTVPASAAVKAIPTAVKSGPAVHPQASTAPAAPATPSNTNALTASLHRLSSEATNASKVGSATPQQQHVSVAKRRDSTQENELSTADPKAAALTTAITTVNDQLKNSNCTARLEVDENSKKPKFVGRDVVGSMVHCEREKLITTPTAGYTLKVPLIGGRTEAIALQIAQELINRAPEEHRNKIKQVKIGDNTYAVNFEGGKLKIEKPEAMSQDISTGQKPGAHFR